MKKIDFLKFIFGELKVKRLHSLGMTRSYVQPQIINEYQTLKIKNNCKPQFNFKYLESEIIENSKNSIIEPEEINVEDYTSMICKAKTQDSKVRTEKESDISSENLIKKTNINNFTNDNENSELENYIKTKAVSFGDKNLINVLLGLIKGIENYYWVETKNTDDDCIKFLIYEKQEDLERVNKLEDFLNETRFKYAQINTGIRFTIVEYTEKNKYIEISEVRLHVKYCNSVTGEYRIPSYYQNVKGQYIIYNLKDVFIRNGTKFYPSQIPTFKLCEDITFNLFNLLSQENNFFKDIITDYKMTKYLPKRSLKTCLNIHSRKQLFESYRKYKKLNIPKKLNRLSIVEGLILLDVALLLSEKDKARLFELDDTFIKSCINYQCEKSYDEKNYVNDFFISYWKYNGIKEFGVYNSNSLKEVLKDYIRLKTIFKETIPLNKKSAGKIVEEHDMLSLRYRLSKTQTIKIPTNSKFLSLKLPKEYEKIKTRKRLVEEGINQRHCVASYDNLINQDKCAIYSYLHEGKRYTIEIQYKYSKFVCIQFLGYKNSQAPKELIDNLNVLLDGQKLKQSSKSV